MPVKETEEAGKRAGPLKSIAVHASVHGHAQAVVIMATGGAPPAAEAAAGGRARVPAPTHHAS